MEAMSRDEWSVSRDGHEVPQQGMVYLVGAGPGDPELMTLKGLHCLRRADVVLYDRLIHPALLDEAGPLAERVFVGKGPNCHAMTQEEINTLLIMQAQQSRIVVRLKGGDPFIFGRGGEEALALAKAGVPFEIVPGVSSALAVPACVGIPVTHRDYASSVTIVTGQEGHVHASPAVNWQAVATLGGTLIILMGVQALPQLTQRLMTNGLDASIPAAVIQEGTTPRQCVVTGTLADIAKRASEAGISPPAVTVIGSVVSLGDALTWQPNPRQPS